jgi:hypothetical protein
MDDKAQWQSGTSGVGKTSEYRKRRHNECDTSPHYKLGVPLLSDNLFDNLTVYTSGNVNRMHMT